MDLFPTMENIDIEKLDISNLKDVELFATIYESIPSNWDKNYKKNTNEIDIIYNKIINVNYENNFVYVARFEKQKIVGICWGTIIFKWESKASHLNALWVDKTYRNMGIGNKLLYKFNEWSKNNNSEFSILNVDFDNNLGINFYLKNDYKSRIIEMIKEF